MRYLGFIFILILFFSCSRENGKLDYAVEDVKFWYEIPDTLFFNKPSVFKAKINVPLAMSFYLGANSDKFLIGVVQPPEGSFSWMPVEEMVKSGENYVSLNILISDNGERRVHILTTSKKVVIK